MYCHFLNHKDLKKKTVFDSFGLMHVLRIRIRIRSLPAWGVICSVVWCIDMVSPVSDGSRVNRLWLGGCCLLVCHFTSLMLCRWYQLCSEGFNHLL